MLYSKNFQSLISVFFYIGIIFFLLLYKNSAYQHWSYILDQDITIIYNSLLLASNLPQEYLDHPAYTTMVILNFFFKLAHLFQFSNITSIHDLINSSDKNYSIQNLYNIAQSVHFFYAFIFLIMLNKIINIYLDDKITSLLLTIFAALSPSFIFLFDIIRSEILSLILCFFYYYFLNKFIKGSLFYLICSGLCFGFAMMAKVQVIFCLYSFLILFYISNYKTKKIIKTNIKFINFILSVSLLLFLAINIYYLDHFFHKRVDKIFYLFIIISHVFVFTKIYKNKIRGEKYFYLIVPIVYFCFGYFSSFGIIVIFSYMELFGMHPGTISIASSPISTLASITTGYSSSSKDNIDFILYMTDYLQKIFKNNLIFNKLSLVTYVLSFFFVFYEFFKKNYSTILLILIVNLIITGLNIVFTIRPYDFYLIYSVPFNIILMAICIRKSQYKLLFTFLILIFYVIFDKKNIYDNANQIRNEKANNMNLICLEENIIDKFSYIRYWHKKFDDDFLRDMCKNYFKKK